MKKTRTISQLLYKIETKFQRLLPPLSYTVIPLELRVKLPDATGSGKSKLAACKLEIRITQRVHKLTTKFQRRYLCFRGPAIQWKLLQCCTTKREETESGKSKIVACKLEIRKTQLVHMIITKFQRLSTHFRGPATRWDLCRCSPTSG